MRTKLFVIAMSFVFLGLPMFSQTFGEITGQVTDPTGAAIGGATITVTNVNTNASRSAVSTDAGVYSFPSLPPGTYNVRVERPGFKTSTSTGVEVQVQQTVRLDFTLAVGQVMESIEVSSTASQLQAENSTVGTVIENRRIVELPLNGRNYLQLVSLSPTSRQLRRRPARPARARAATARASPSPSRANFPNHPVWTSPNVNANNPNTFAVISVTRTDMRNMQVALKYVLLTGRAGGFASMSYSFSSAEELRLWGGPPGPWPAPTVSS